MRALWVLLKKELLDVVRDRRTLALTLLLPMLLYPGMLLTMGAVIAAGRERLKNEALVVAVASDDAAAFLADQPVPPKTSYKRLSRADGEAALREQQVAALVDAPGGARRAVAEGRQAVLTVLYTKRYDRSMEGLERLRPVLAALNDSALSLRLGERQLEPTFAAPVKADLVDTDFQKDLGPLIASRLLPIVLLVMLFVGALYPAVDLTAGEKERGTFETLLVAPVRPLQVMAAKYLTVSLAAVVSALVNLAAMAATFGAGLSLGDAKERIAVQLTASQVLVMVACLVPAAFLVAGVSLAVASVARTFKEGQSLMTPVMLAGLAPALLSQMPGVELNALTALVPLLNVALLVKAAVLGTATALHVLLTMASVLACGALALKLAALAFENEAFRFGGTPALVRLLGLKK